MDRIMHGLTSILIMILVSVTAVVGHSQTGNAPEIVFIDFPTQMAADGKPVTGLVVFKDADGDLARAEFKVTEAKDLKSFTLDVADKVKGQTAGAIQYSIATATPQRVTMEVTLIDAKGLRSQPKPFSFEAVGQQTGGPRLQVTPGTLNFRAPVGGQKPANQTLTITNAGTTGTLSWTAQAQADGDWLQVSRASGGPLGPNASESVTVSVDAAGIGEGQLQGRIVFTAQGAQNSPVVVDVNLTLVADLAVLQVSPGTLSFRGQAGGANPAAQSLTITNAGGGTLNWVASAGAPWIQLSVTSGTVPSTLTVSVQIAGLSAGAQRGRIIISAEGAQGSPATVSVTLTLEARPAVLQVSASTLSFSGQEGASNPTAQSIRIRNSGESPMEWTAQADANWLQLSPTRGTLAPNQSAELRVVANITGLRAGTTQARITVTAEGAQGSPAVVTVGLVLQPRAHVANPRVVGTVFVGKRPSGIAVSPDGQRVYVATYEQTAKLTVIDARTHQYINQVATSGSYPLAVAVSADGRRIYVVNSGSNDVSVIDAQTLKVTDQVSVGRNPYGIALSPDGRRAYVTNFDSNSVSVIDTALQREITTIDGIGPGPSDIRITPDGNLAYVATSQIVVLDLRSNTVLTRIKPDGDFEPWRFAVNPNGRTVYVTLDEPDQNTVGRVGVIDTASQRLVASIPIGRDPFGINITLDGSFVLACDTGSNDVSLIDTDRNTLAATISDPSYLVQPYEVAVTPDNQKAFVTNETNSVSVIDLNIR